MREIKFRGFDKIKNELYNAVGFIDWSKKYCQLAIIDSLGNCYAEVKRPLCDVVFEQFTGLIDKNGKEIYEGDKLRYERVGKFTIDYIVNFGKINIAESCETSHEMLVVGFYLEPVLNRYNPDIDLCYVNQMEIIGNIHETK